MSNIHFARKIASDELLDTIFFSSGQRGHKTHAPTGVILHNETVKVFVSSFKHITVNDRLYKTVSNAKTAIMQLYS